MSSPEDSGAPDAVALMLGILDLDSSAARTEQDIFTAVSHPMPSGRIFGGQVLSQSILAAQRTLDPERVPHSMHGYFLRPGDAAQPVTIAVDRIHDGRSFARRRTQVYQNGAPIFSAIASFERESAGFEHSEPMPTGIPDPESLPDSFGADGSRAAGLRGSQATPIDLRHVQGPIYVDAPDPQRASQAVWLRVKRPVTDDPAIQRALLAYLSDFTIQESVLRAHGVAWATPGLNVASLDHAIWWHEQADVSQWLLYVQESPFARGGRGLATGRIYRRDGALAASVAQEIMIRVPQADADSLTSAPAIRGMSATCERIDRWWLSSQRPATSDCVRPSPVVSPGTAKAPEAFRASGLFDAFAAQGARDAGIVLPGRYVDDDPWRPPGRVRNQGALVEHARRLSAEIENVWAGGETPLILGGDCSLLLGAGLAAARTRRVGLVHIDGHTDFRHPGNSDAYGSVAGEDLALVTGFHLPELSMIDGLGPYVDPARTAHIGHRSDDEHRVEARERLGVGGVRRRRGQPRGRVVGTDGIDRRRRPLLAPPRRRRARSHGHARRRLPRARWSRVRSGARPAPAARAACGGRDRDRVRPDLDPDGRYARRLTDLLVSALLGLGSGAR